MSIRLRQHSDGCVALSVIAGYWTIIKATYLAVPVCKDSHVSGEGWSELFVTKLPEPEGWTECIGIDGEDSQVPYWLTRRGSVTAWTDGVQDDWGLQEGREIDDARAEALSMLAAIAVHERFRAAQLTITQLPGE
jgi:hypothetical protein